MSKSLDNTPTLSDVCGRFGVLPLHTMLSNLSDAAKLLYAHMTAHCTHRAPLYAHCQAFACQALGWSSSKASRVFGELSASGRIAKTENTNRWGSPIWRVHFAGHAPATVPEDGNKPCPTDGKPLVPTRGTPLVPGGGQNPDPQTKSDSPRSETDEKDKPATVDNPQGGGFDASLWETMTKRFGKAGATPKIKHWAEKAGKRYGHDLVQRALLGAAGDAWWNGSNGKRQMPVGSALKAVLRDDDRLNDLAQRYADQQKAHVDDEAVKNRKKAQQAKLDAMATPTKSEENDDAAGIFFNHFNAGKTRLVDEARKALQQVTT